MECRARSRERCEHRFDRSRVQMPSVPCNAHRRLDVVGHAHRLPPLMARPRYPSTVRPPLASSVHCDASYQSPNPPSSVATMPMAACRVVPLSTPEMVMTNPPLSKNSRRNVRGVHASEPRIARGVIAHHATAQATRNVGQPDASQMSVLYPTLGYSRQESSSAARRGHGVSSVPR